MIFLICCCCCCLNSIAKSLCAGRERSTCKAQGGFPPKRSRGPGKVSPCKGRSDAAWQGGKQRFGSARAETHQPREGQQVATLPSIAVYCSHSDSRWPGRVQPPPAIRCGTHTHNATDSSGTCVLEGNCTQHGLTLSKPRHGREAAKHLTLLPGANSIPKTCF